MDESILRRCGLIPAPGYGSHGIWCTVTNKKPGPLWLVLLGENIAVGPQIGTPLWKGHLKNEDELKRCLAHCAKQLQIKTDETTPNKEAAP